MRTLPSMPCPCYCLCCTQYAFNLFSHNSKMDVALGYNEEEMKMVKETHKIWNEKAVRACSRPGHLKSAWRQEHAC